MGRSEPGGEKERELGRMAIMVIAAGRREGRQANDLRTFNEKTIKQAKTGLSNNSVTVWSDAKTFLNDVQGYCCEIDKFLSVVYNIC